MLTVALVPRLKPDPAGDRRWMQPHWAVEGIR